MSWENFGEIGQVTSNISSIRRGPYIECFAIGSDNALKQIQWNGRRWNGLVNLGGIIITSDPVAINWDLERKDVFARGTDDALHHRGWDGRAWGGGAWGGWENLGGLVTGPISVVSWEPGRIDVFVSGSDRAVHHIAWTGRSWSSWERLGGTNISNDITAVSWGPNRIDVFARNNDGGINHIAWNGRAWSAWVNLDDFIRGSRVRIAGRIAAECWGPNRIDCFAKGRDGAMQHIWHDGINWGLHPLPGLSIRTNFSNPTVVSWGADRLDVFINGGPEDLVYYISWGGGTWSRWQILGRGLTGDISATTRDGNRIDLFATRGNTMQHEFWDGAHWRPEEAIVHG